MSNQHKHPTISFRINDAERKQIEARILASGMMKKDYFVRSCIYNRICVVGKKETIYPLVQTVNALYLKLLEMQKTFTKCCEHPPLNNLSTSDKIKELQTDYNNMLTAIIALLDGAKSICGKENTIKQNNPCYLFDMYEPDTEMPARTLFILSAVRNVIPPLSLMPQMMLHICSSWQRKHLFCMPN